MDNLDKENYFSIYMKKKEINNKKKKTTSGKPNKTFKTSNFSNLHIPQGKSLKKIVFESEKKEKPQKTIKRNKLSEKNIKDSITRNKENIDNDKKIDMLEARIFGILDLIDNFKTEYINKNEIPFKEKIKNHFDKTNNLNKIEIKDKNIEKKTKKNKNISYRSISSTNTERQQKFLMTNNNKKKKNKTNINININNFINSNPNKNSNINFRNVKRPYHQKSNSQLLNSDKKLKESLLQRRIDYANLINQNFVKRKKKQLSQSQVFVNKNILYYSPKIKKINSNLYVELGSDNSSTREISDKIYIGNNKTKKKKKPTIVSTINNKYRDFKINNFKQLNRIYTDNNIKCSSERAQRLTNITKKYKFDFENL